MFNDNNFFSGGAAEAGFYDHPIEQSLRFNDDDSAYLTRTPSSAGNRKTWTWSGWVKRGAVTTTNGIFEAYDSGGASFFLGFRTSTEDLAIAATAGVSPSWGTSAKFRDPSAWYHIVAVVDTTSATSTITNGSTDRIRLYVNGVQQTLSGGTVPSQNADLQVNSTLPHHIGRFQAGGFYNDGYLAEVHFIDGTALDADSFGEFKSGVWIPKAYSGSYGTNGFYLDFDGTYYNDKSGNGNNWTANNLAATDVVLDSPTNNFATLNPLVNNSIGSFAEGNLKTTGTVGWESAASTWGFNSGKHYFEANPTSALGGSFTHGLGVTIGSGDVIYKTTSVFTGEASDSYGCLINSGTADYYNNASSVTAMSGSYSTASVMQVAIDVDNGKCWLGVNNSWIGGGNPSSDTSPTFTFTAGSYICPHISHYTASTLVTNFGQDSSFAGNKTAQGNTDDNGYGDFYYAPPTGYLALCTANLEVPDAMNPALDNSPQDYFNTVLYTGDDTSNRAITGVGFQPDLVWYKSRNTSVSHALTDAVRGVGKELFSNNTNVEANIPALASFDSDGFTIDAASQNNSSRTYVAWNWKANGSGVSNTDGSITSTVSANTDAGFSIVSYEGGGSGTQTVGHGLSSAPEFVIVKNRDESQAWVQWFKDFTASQYLRFDTSSTSSYTNFWGGTPSSSVIYVGSDRYATVSKANIDYIAYCFHSVEGFSKFGSYTGNGSTDGTFVYTGFRPAFVMVKKTNSTGSWVVYDNERPYAATLYPNLSAAEYTSSSEYGFDLLSNGFKFRGAYTNINASGDTYIYMAFSQSPFKYSTAR